MWGLLPKTEVRRPQGFVQKTHENMETQESEGDYFQLEGLESTSRLSQARAPIKASSEVKDEYCAHLDEMPSLPSIWTNLQRAIEQGDSAKKIAQLIKDEPTLAVKVLRHANEVAKREVNDLGQAIVLLGYNAVRGIVTKYCMSSLKHEGQSHYKRSELWRHAIAVSALSNVVARYIPGCDTGIAGTLGLLHDIGRIGINTVLKKRAVVSEDISQGYLYFERKTFGITHVEAGALLAKHWKLTQTIQEAIVYHHHPSFAEPSKIPEHIRKEVLAVYLADILAIHFEFSGGHNFITLPQPEYASLMSASLQTIADDPAVSKELWRVKSINF